jgi:proline dehydrogenase
MTRQFALPRGVVKEISRVVTQGKPRKIHQVEENSVPSLARQMEEAQTVEEVYAQGDKVIRTKRKRVDQPLSITQGEYIVSIMTSYFLLIHAILVGALRCHRRGGHV